MKKVDFRQLKITSDTDKIEVWLAIITITFILTRHRRNIIILYCVPVKLS